MQGPLNFVPVGGGTYTGDVTIAAHLQFSSPTPSAAISAGAGSGAPAPVIVTGSNDGAGTINWGTGSGPNTQKQLTLTFGRPFVIPGGGAPHIVVSPQNAATAALGIFPSGASPTGYNLGVQNAPSAGQGSSTYSFSYIVTG